MHWRSLSIVLGRVERVEGVQGSVMEWSIFFDPRRLISELLCLSKYYLKIKTFWNPQIRRLPSQFDSLQPKNTGNLELWQNRESRSSQQTLPITSWVFAKAFNIPDLNERNTIVLGASWLADNCSNVKASYTLQPHMQKTSFMHTSTSLA